jgi:hypothetical protein
MSDQPALFKFMAHPDITAYQIAQLLQTIDFLITEQMYDGLSEELKSFFVPKVMGE